MKIITPDPKNPTQEDIQQITQTLKNGGIVLFPTETVYTFAVDATDDNAIRQVYNLKGRDYSKPFHVVVASMDEAEKYVQIDERAIILAEKFLPGPLTLVLPKKENTLPDILTSGFPTLGIRIPDIQLCIDVAKQFGKPYTTTSANISGGATPYSVEEVLMQFDQGETSQIDLIVDIGVLPHLLPSTMIDLTSEDMVFIRKGPITEEDIIKKLNDI